MADKGFTDKVKGKVKEVAGDITGDNAEKASGLVDQVVGKAKEVASNAKDVAEEVVEKAKDKIDNDTGGTDCCKGISTKRFADDHRVSKCIKKLKKISENNRNCKF